MNRRNGASKQNWQTPRWLFEAIESRLGVRFDVDGAAERDGSNSLCGKWMAQGSRYQESTQWFGDALEALWPKANIFINPPFKNILPWVEAIQRNRHRVKTVALLVPSATETKWFRRCDEIGGTCWFLYPRVAYIDPDGEKKVSPPSGSCVWIFNPIPQSPSFYKHLEMRP